MRSNRRKFIQDCAVGVAVLGSGPLMGFIAERGPARKIIPLDENWFFGWRIDPSALSQGFEDKGFSPVTLPHCVAKLSWQQWNFADWEAAWGYSNRFSLPAAVGGMRTFLHFDGVMVGAFPRINGHALPAHYGGYLPFSYEITDFVREGENTLLVGVDSCWSNVPPEGSADGAKRIDYLEPGGIHRKVWIEMVPRVFIRDVFAKPVNVLGADRAVEVRCSIDADSGLRKAARVRVELKDGGRVMTRAETAVEVRETGVAEVLLRLSGLGDVTLWDIDNPRLYDIETTLLVDGRPLHNYKTRTGLREARFTVDGFFLNGKRVQIFGLNRHELFPYAGFAMPDRIMRRDAEILKKEFNCNMVRCSHYPQREAFLDACDELGLMVWEEIPGWNYIGDASWKELCVRDVRDMIVRDRNHPAIIIWGTRINESHNDVELYKKTRALARSLDDSRPSSGTMTSHSTGNGWDEDVFSFDDYNRGPHGGVDIWGPVEGFPYLISEAVGQFNYITGKGFNAYYRRDADVKMQQLQALVHAQAHEKAAESPRTCGVIAWCAFEYSSLVNSYKGLKNPGVADFFRIPKLGASFYQSQQEVKKGAVIQPNFYWDFGSRCPGGPGAHAAIFSNCDRLELFVNEAHHSSLRPDRDNYPHLRFPPFFADLEMPGGQLPELRIQGYVGDEMLLRRTFSADTRSDEFSVAADDQELTGDGSDGTRVVFRVVDKYGAPRPFAGGTVQFHLEGPGVLVGDNPFDLGGSGGAAAVWIRTKPGGSGAVLLRATHSSLGTKTIRIAVR